MAELRLTEEDKLALKSIVDHFTIEDKAVRERQLRQWRRLKLYWNGFQRVFYDEVAHDWRVWDEELREENNEAPYYDKPINIFRAYLESIIAALSITIPAVKCLPDDAEDTLDLQTARAGDKIGRLIHRHIDAPLKWLHALYILSTEGMVAAYTYPKEDEEYGTYKEAKVEETEEEHYQCENCGRIISDDEWKDINKLDNLERAEYDPGDDDILVQDALNRGPVCPECLVALDPQLQKTMTIVERIVGENTKLKSRMCADIYGGLYVKVPNYAMTQKDCPYLSFSYETHFSEATSRYKDLKDKYGDRVKAQPGSGGIEQYERWARLSPQYRGDIPVNTVTIRNWWLRPCAFNVLDDDKCKRLQKLFPSGVKVVYVNEDFAEACNESLDDCWTLTYNPMSDYIHSEPLGMSLVSVQDITNDLVALTLQTIEQGIPQTFVDTQIVDMEAYRNAEAAPGSLYATKTSPQRNLAEYFYTFKAAQLGTEVMPFGKAIQDFGQLTSGALPSLFGGMAEAGSKTAAEYSMSRAQALQRLQTTWKIFLYWWKNLNGKLINSYIKELVVDERFVERNKVGDFVNVVIKKVELNGKIGSFELDASENLPVTWQQKKDVLMQLFPLANNPIIQRILQDPKNIPFIAESLGIPELSIPGEEDRIKQWDEIKLLLGATPLPDIDPMTGMETEVPSVQVDQLLDDHQVEAGICRDFLISEEGRQAKEDNPEGYMNVLLHMKQHMMFAMQAAQNMQMQQEQTQLGAEGNQPPQNEGNENGGSRESGTESIH